MRMSIGADTMVHTADFTFKYPPDGGFVMDLTLAGTPVTIENPQGKFYADAVEVTVSATGARKIQAVGLDEIQGAGG